MLTDEACNFHDNGLTRGTFQKFQRTGLGHTVTDNTDDDCYTHCDDNPDGSNSSGENQLLLILDCHEAKQNMGHSEISESPRHGGDDGNRSVRRCSVAGHVMHGCQGKIACQGLRIIYHSIHTTRGGDTKAKHNNQCDGHDTALNQVRRGNGTETAHDGITQNYHS